MTGDRVSGIAARICYLYFHAYGLNKQQSTGSEWVTFASALAWNSWQMNPGLL